MEKLGKTLGTPWGSNLKNQRKAALVLVTGVVSRNIFLGGVGQQGKPWGKSLRLRAERDVDCAG